MVLRVAVGVAKIRLPQQQDMCLCCGCSHTLLVSNLIVSCLPNSSARSSWPAQLNLIVSAGRIPAPAGVPRRLVLQRPSRHLGGVARRHPLLILLLPPHTHLPAPLAQAF